MRVRAWDSNGDYTCTGTASEFLVNSSAAVAQCIASALQLWVGQWFIDTGAGMPWQTEVLGKYPKPVYDQVIKTAILAVTGVQAITNYSSSVSNRVLTVQVSVNTVYGPTSVTVTL